MANNPDSRPSWAQRHPAAFALISLFAAAFLIRLRTLKASRAGGGGQAT